MAEAESFVPFQCIRNDVIWRLKSYKHDWISGFRAGFRYVQVSSLLLLHKVLLLERDKVDLHLWKSLGVCINNWSGCGFVKFLTLKETIVFCMICAALEKLSLISSMVMIALIFIDHVCVGWLNDSKEYIDARKAIDDVGIWFWRSGTFLLVVYLHA